MELKYLEIFCKVVEEKSFSKAAVVLNLTQPTVSIHIKSLEEELGMTFLDRLGRSVVPTRAGEVLYKYARDIVKLKEEAREALYEYAGVLKGRLVIGASTIPAEHILPSILCRFKNKYPGVVPSVTVGSSDDIYNLVIEGKVDIGVAGSNYKDRSIRYKEFHDDEIVLVANSKFNGDTLSKKELTAAPLLLRSKGSGSRKKVEKALDERGINVSSINHLAEFGSTQSLIEAIKCGMGLGFISKVAVEELISSGTLKLIGIPGPPIKRNFYIITHRSRSASPLTVAFLDYISS